MFYTLPRKNVIKRDHATQTPHAAKKLCSMPATVYLAEKMGALLGRGALLQRAVPS
ncbi:hypothetical protein KUC_2355 [Vreelandella boliviensis LC1]|uniref:Uncharacterized protein n=1 Tax=Vreelandella boliviensis LC1 TaxID=1072583 RepID=A0A7U9GG45_9GAMM|nr:hypothetical protein KUC_2355 [Halomonas boliviensis LC1]